jgi:hypothetical protein
MENSQSIGKAVPEPGSVLTECHFPLSRMIKDVIMRDKPTNVAVEGPQVMWLKMPRASNDTSGKLVNASVGPFGYRARIG